LPSVSQTPNNAQKPTKKCFLPINSYSVLRNMLDDSYIQIWKLRSKGNRAGDFPIARCFGQSSRPNRVINGFLVHRIITNVLNWWHRFDIPNCTSLPLEIVLKLHHISVTLKSNYELSVNSISRNMKFSSNALESGNHSLANRITSFNRSSKYRFQNIL
jgi:hypothetical protein